VNPGEQTPQDEDVFDDSDAFWWDGGIQADATESFVPRKIDNPLDKFSRRQGGKRSRTKTDRKRGRYIRAREPRGKVRDVAFDATIRAAAPYQQARKDFNQNVAFKIRKSDIKEKVRVRKAANLVLFVVDASWSMAVAERMEATKGAIFSLLTDAYQRRDRVGLIVFQKDRANLILPPTNSTQLAERALADIPIGGKTPLSAGLYLAHEVVRLERMKHPDVMPLIILLTDGAGNVAIGKEAPEKEAHRLAEEIAKDDIQSVVVDMEGFSFDEGHSKKLAKHLKAQIYTLDQLRADKIVETVRREQQYLAEGRIVTV
jgi:magnesium chelatase subunit D